MSATQPIRTALVGEHITLEPFSRDHIPGLWDAIGRPEVFAGGYGGGPAGLPDGPEAFATWIREYLPHEQGNSYVAVLRNGPHRGRVVGTSSLTLFELRRQQLHLGWTAWDPAVWAGPVNPEAKLLLLTEAFAHGFGRVEFSADMRNERSRGALAKLGATFEGVARRNSPRADGSWRDSAQFAITVDDWAEVRAKLELRIAQAAEWEFSEAPAPTSN